jgi:hypothetical protein
MKKPFFHLEGFTVSNIDKNNITDKLIKFITVVRQHDTYLKRSLNLVNESIFSPSKG